MHRHSHGELHVGPSRVGFRIILREQYDIGVEHLVEINVDARPISREPLRVLNAPCRMSRLPQRETAPADDRAALRAPLRLKALEAERGALGGRPEDAPPALVRRERGASRFYYRARPSSSTFGSVKLTSHFLRYGLARPEG